MPYVVKSTWHPIVCLVGAGDVVLVVLALAGQPNSAMTLDLFLPSANLLRVETGRSAGPWWSDVTARAGCTMMTTKLNTEHNTFYRAMHYSTKRGRAIACRLSVCPSVTLVDQDHIGWKSWKLIARTISPAQGCS